MTPPHGHGRGGAHGHAPGMPYRDVEHRRLTWAMGITAAFMVAEVAGGLLSGSLALLADAGHMLTDAGAFLLHAHAGENLNVRGAYLHVLGDLLGSVGAITAGLVVLFTGWTAADPAISVVIAALILLSAWRLVRDASDDPAQHTRILAKIQEKAGARGIGHLTFQLEMRPLHQLPPPPERN